MAENDIEFMNNIAILNEAMTRAALDEERDGAAKIRQSFSHLEYLSSVQSVIPAGWNTPDPVHMNMASALANINIDFQSQSMEKTLSLVVFGLPEGKDVCFALTRVSETRWWFDGIIELPEEIPDLTFSLLSDVVGDIGCTFLSGDDMMRAKSWAIAEPKTVTWAMIEDCDDPSSQIIMSLSVWPLLLEARIDHNDMVTALQAPALQAPSELTHEAWNIARETFFAAQNSDDPVIIEAAVASHREALATVPNNCTSGLAALIRLSQLLLHLSRLSSSADGLDDSIAVAGQAMELASSGNIDGSEQLLPSAMYALGSVLKQRYNINWDKEDLDKAIILFRQAAHVGEDLANDGSELRAHAWSDLGTALGERYHNELTGMDDVEEAVVSFRMALQVASPGSTFHSKTMLNLGASLCVRWIRTRSREDADESLKHLTEGFRIGEQGAPEAAELGCLGAGYYIQFREYGDIDNLHKAISTYQKAFQLTGGNPGYIGDDLAQALTLHFQHTREYRSLTQALDVSKRVIAANEGQRRPATLDRIATAMSHLVRTVGDKDEVCSGLRRVVEMMEDVIDATPQGHATLPVYLRKLGIYYIELFEITEDLEDIQRAIDALQKAAESALTTIPTGSGLILADIGLAFKCRYTVSHDISDIEEAISTLKKSLKILPDDDSEFTTDRTVHCGHLGDALETRYTISGDPADIEEAIFHYTLGASLETAAISVRLSAARQWAICAMKHYGHEQALEPFEVVVDLVAVVAGLEETVRRRHELLARYSVTILEASVTAILADRVDKAVGWLEQGRGLVWAQLNSLRMPLDLLRSRSPTLAERLERVCRALEAAGSETRFSQKGVIFAGGFDDDLTVHDQASKHLQLARDRQTVLQEIRQEVPGFEHFLQPRPCSAWFEHLPESGPVVLINVQKLRCDAIALIAGLDEPILIPLPDFSFVQAEQLGKLMKTTLSEKMLRMRGYELEADSNDRAIRPPRRDGFSQNAHNRLSPIEQVLRQLWLCVAKPIIDALALSHTDDIPTTRIWWCPTGPLTFLPLHAAGIYRGHDAVDLSNYAVSSYTPTVGVLTERLRKPRDIPADKSGVLLVSVPNAPGCSSIPGATIEVDRVSEQFTNLQIRTLRLDGDEATVEAGLEGMRNFSCVHLACHAVQDADEPLKSAFRFHDGRLDLSTIITSDLKTAGFAFLSACQTSTGVERLSEEAVHLAAGMLAAGYRGVVATMWSIQDGYAPQVADDFYEDIFTDTGGDGQGVVNGALAAYALHRSVKRLRNRVQGDVEDSFLTWVSYVHFGL